MAGVVNWHCIRHFDAQATRCSSTSGNALSLRILSNGSARNLRPFGGLLQLNAVSVGIVSGGRIRNLRPFGGLQLSLWHRKQGNCRPVKVLAGKGGVRQKQKASNPGMPVAPDNAIRPPSVRGPGPISAPALTDTSPEDEEVVDTSSRVINSSVESIVSSTAGKQLEARIASAPRRNVSSAISESSPWSVFPRLGRQILRQLSSFQLAIAELVVIAALSALGTIIEQNESPQFYFDSYPEENPMFGFLSWRFIFAGSLDHIYSSWYYLGLLLLLAASLVACSTTRQFPMVKVARRWSFLKSVTAFEKLPISETLEKARIGDFATLLMAEGFEVFARGPTLYAFKGLAGRYAPIGVHVALLLIMGGATLSAIASYRGTVMVPQGLGFQINDVVVPNGILSTPSSVMNDQVNINKFFIDYRSNGAVSQFHSDISILDLRNKEVYRKTIAVNDPLRYGGLTMYQTDWAISALQVRVDESEPFNLVMASLEKGDKKLFGTFLPLGADGLDNAKGISFLARDLQSVVIYDQEGKFVGVRRPGSGKPISVDGVSIVVDDIIGSSGLELKMDPGIPAVYAGFGGLMLTTCISYLSHSQIWALQTGTALVVGGKTNRAKAEFNIQLNQILDLVPEVTKNSGSSERILVNAISSSNSSSCSSSNTISSLVKGNGTSREEEVQSR